MTQLSFSLEFTPLIKILCLCRHSFVQQPPQNFMPGGLSMPQTTHFLFSKNCTAPQRGFSHRVISDAPHFRTFSARRCASHNGADDVERPSAARADRLRLFTWRWQVWQRHPKRLPLPQTGQKRESARRGSSSGCRAFLVCHAQSSCFAPHSPQKRAPSTTSAPQLGHFFAPSGAPQLEQNFPLPHGLPHCGQRIDLFSSVPLHTVCSVAASSRLRCMAAARALVTATFSNGEHSTHRSAASL